jgi:peptidoglycan glycosyltransferase
VAARPGAGAVDIWQDGVVTDDAWARERGRRPAPPRRSAAGWVALIILATLAGLGILTAMAVVGGYLSLSRDLIPTSALEKIEYAEESVIYDRSGATELARFGEVRREVVTFDQLPKPLIDATTAVEDRTFWTNPGFDPAAIVASGIDALRGNARGASTITQQLVRQRLLDPALVQSSSRTFERKLKEIIQSIRLTKAYPGQDGKQRIITAYLNQNFYGNNSYGVKAAAQGYFGKDLKDLTVAEAATLAALPQSPSSYDLVRNAVTTADGKLVVPPTTAIVQRRNRVLDLMAQGRTPLSNLTFTPAQLAAAKGEVLAVADQSTTPYTAPHFVWAVREELASRLCGEAATCPTLERGGFRVTTTLDLRLQQAAEKWVKAATLVPTAADPAGAAKALGLTYDAWMRNLRNKEVNNGALVALDYQTGELLAYVGSADYYATKGSPQFQPKFDVVGDGWRQPGSAVKPFNYVVGIDDGVMTAATMFMDVGTDFGGGYSPEDADSTERGPVRLRNALQFSLNIPSVKAAAVNGPDHVFRRAQDLGLRFQAEQTDAGLSIGLGVEEVRPVDLVTGYGTLANSGRYLAHTTILRVRSPDGRDLVPPYQAPGGRQVVKAESAAVITDILAGNTDAKINPFWGKFAVTDGKGRRPATLKTGTNNDARDLNAYGYIAAPTAEGRQKGEYALAVGAWNGNSDNTPVSTPQRPVFSIDVSTYVWQGFMNEATKGWAINDFARPAGLETAAVDPLIGLRVPEGAGSVQELFVKGSVPTQTVGGVGGVCGDALLDKTGFESRFSNWLAADRDWIERARRGPGVKGGPDNNPTAYFYNSSFNPYGKTWGALLAGPGCGSPSPAPTCFPLPAPDASGVIPSFALPTPVGSEPAVVPCPTPEPTESPSASPSAPPSPSVPPSPSPTPTRAPTPTPTARPNQPTPTPTPTPTPAPTSAPSPTAASSPAALPSP